MYETEWREWIKDHWTKNNSGNQRQQVNICKYGMAEEMGELMGHFKRLERGDPKPYRELLLELGDVLHYIHRYMQLAGIDPEEVYRLNYHKLIERYGK